MREVITLGGLGTPLGLLVIACGCLSGLAIAGLGVQSLLSRAGKNRRIGGLAVLVGLGMIGYLLPFFFQFQRVVVEGDGTWRLQNGLRMGLGSIPPDVDRDVHMEAVTVKTTNRTIHTYALKINAGGKSWQSVTEPEAIVAPALERLLASRAPRGGAAPRGRMGPLVLLGVGLLEFLALGYGVLRWRLATTRLRRWTEATHGRWYTGRLAAPLELTAPLAKRPYKDSYVVESPAGAADLAFSPSEFDLLLDGGEAAPDTYRDGPRTLRVHADKAWYPAPVRCRKGDYGPAYLARFGLAAVDAGEDAAPKQRFRRRLEAGATVEVLGLERDGVLVPGAMPMLIVDPSTAPRVDWIGEALGVVEEQATTGLVLAGGTALVGIPVLLLLSLYL